MNNEQDGLAEVIAFPGGNAGHEAAQGDRKDHLARLRAKMTNTESDYAPTKPRKPPEFSPTDVASIEADTDDSNARGRSSSSIARMPGIADHDEATVEDASDQLVRALARSPKSVSEAESLLVASTELTGQEREQIINRMIDLGYLDDLRLAEQLVAGSLSRKGLGRGGMSRELRKRGLEDSVIQEALGEPDRDEEFDRALDLARERASRLRGLDYETAQRRLYGYLARRGFGGDIVGRAVREALA